MKKKLFILLSIVLIATMALCYGCSKENNESAATEEYSSVTKVTNQAALGTNPHFKYRNSLNPLIPCNQLNGTTWCGFDLDATLTGDETCWIELHKLESGRLSFGSLYMSTSFLDKNGATNLIDSTECGYISLHDDCIFLSANLVQLTGEELIPAGRYPIEVTYFNEEECICICFDAAL